MKSAVTELNQWRQLSSTDKLAQFQQILRYFVSPLLPIDEIGLETVATNDFEYETGSVLISGQKFIYVPSQAQVPLGWQKGSQTLTHDQKFGQTKQQANVESFFWPDDYAVDQFINQFTTATRTRHLPAVLIAQQALPIDWQAVGYYWPEMRCFSGQPHFYQHNKAVIDNLLYQARQKQQWPEQLATNDLQLRYMADLHAYQILVKQAVSQADLRLQLLKMGFDFISPDQYEWLKSNHQYTLLPSLKGCYGVDFTSYQNAYEVTSDPLVYKGGSITAESSYQLVTQLAQSPYFESGALTAALGAKQQVIWYRPTITVALD